MKTKSFGYNFNKNHAGIFVAPESCLEGRMLEQKMKLLGWRVSKSIKKVPWKRRQSVLILFERRPEAYVFSPENQEQPQPLTPRTVAND